MKSAWLFLAFGATMTGTAMANPPSASTAPATNTAPNDPYLWLEDIHGA